jgi:hypothetical protein
VKYRKMLLDDEVIRIITETALGIEERYDIEMERIGCDKDQVHLLCSTSEDSAWPNCKDIQEYNSEGDISEEADSEEGTVGSGVLDRWILRRDSRGTGKLDSRGRLRSKAGEAERRSSAVRTFQIDRYPAVSAARLFISLSNIPLPKLYLGCLFQDQFFCSHFLTGFCTPALDIFTLRFSRNLSERAE